MSQPTGPVGVVAVQSEIIPLGQGGHPPSPT